MSLARYEVRGSCRGGRLRGLDLEGAGNGGDMDSHYFYFLSNVCFDLS